MILCVQDHIDCKQEFRFEDFTNLCAYNPSDHLSVV